MALSLVEADSHAAPTSFMEVTPVSTMELLTSPDGLTNQWPMKLMKNGHRPYAESGQT